MKNSLVFILGALMLTTFMVGTGSAITLGNSWTKVAVIDGRSETVTRGSLEDIHDSINDGAEIRIVSTSFDRWEQTYSFNCVDTFTGISSGTHQEIFECYGPSYAGHGGEKIQSRHFEFVKETDGSTWMNFGDQRFDGEGNGEHSDWGYGRKFEVYASL